MDLRSWLELTQTSPLLFVACEFDLFHCFVILLIATRFEDVFPLFKLVPSVG